MAALDFDRGLASAIDHEVVWRINKKFFWVRLTIDVWHHGELGLMVASHRHLYAVVCGRYILVDILNNA